MSWAAIAAVVIGAGASVGIAAASQPELTNPAKSSRKAVNAALKALPGQRKVEAAARLGEEVDYEADNWMRPPEAYKAGLISKEQWEYFKDLNERDGNAFFNRPGKDATKDERAGKHHGYDVRVKDGHMQINIKKRHADFRGMGDADVQGEMARRMAEIQLELQRKYGADFIEEARKQQEQADPEGTAARRMLADEIVRMDEERKTRTRPVAEAVDSQILGELEAGSRLDPESMAAIESVLARRGDTTVGAGDVSAEMESGLAGDARKSARLQRAMSYMGSGASPTDAAFRDRQQSLANMASFLGGRTPQSQFQGLQAAQQGASPMPQGGALPNVPGNLNQMAGQAGLGAYQAGVRNAANQISPYFAGLSVLVQGANVAGSAGWQPLAQKK